MMDVATRGNRQRPADVRRPLLGLIPGPTDAALKLQFEY
jgi:hypothetical protein